ncbi:TRAP transporter substrate-binding protein [Ectothiorhodospira marina]|jgi:TRAP-type mannitol/chloroaromatic compound transport system substrate-binding protein|uniref:TRAP-type mannitol/chloroaromatic compound transport system, substrate-binding protein n=1 Tax=Ectothiorhodospira marina TaxID=1396821 RepID=A0A1H7JB83_9GAMM|nr:TRAP transporter substrate-binding protein [Ectothiorhodospira marina]SEK70545.1 TRAP-type mannitol/chloroaromatic compound transport system, substrate-binding protein [Ectothiorhodospira marina]
MRRREFLGKAGGLAALASAGALAGCGSPEANGESTGVRDTGLRFHWRMVTAWPHGSPGLGAGAEYLARAINELSGGRISVRVFGADDLVPALEVFDAVARGSAEIGHGAAHYWEDVGPAAQLFTSVPFGMNAQETHAWLYQGGGLALWRDLYRHFDVIPFPCGNTGAQMGGWFKQEIHELSDLEGLSIRMSGLGGEVMRRAGARVVSMAGDDIPEAMRGGRLDAAEWVGPYGDRDLGLHRWGWHYYYPGWQQPSSLVEALINREAYEALPSGLQQAVTHACRVASDHMLMEFTARNQQALDELVSVYDVPVQRFPDPVLASLRRLTDEVLEEMADEDSTAGRVIRSYQDFQSQLARWRELTNLDPSAG